MAVRDAGDAALTPPLFHSPIGLYPFQAEFVGYGYLTDSNLIAADTGLGKTVISLATIGLLFEDNLIDHALVLVEQNKLDEWEGDFETFVPSLRVTRYRGSKTARGRRLQRPGHIILTTHQTAREDFLTKDKYAYGPLTEALRGKRVFVVLDEMTVYGNMDSALHSNLRAALDEWSRHATAVRRMGLTGTPLTSSPWSYYCLGLILCPDRMQTREVFYSDHVVEFDLYGRPKKFRHLDLLDQRMSPVLRRKRKTDPDVRDLFPHPVEKFVVKSLDPDHFEVYCHLNALVDEMPGSPMVFGTLRNFANHPQTLLESGSKLAEMYFERHSTESIAKLSCSKAAAVLDDIRVIVSSGEQALVFCDSTMVLRALSRDFTKAGIDHGMYLGTGSMSVREREQAKADFKAGVFPVLLLSSSGERGMNLPEATNIINYDIPLLHSSYIQRLSRGSRIGSNAGGMILVKSYVARGTVEEGAVAAWRRRNAWSDELIDRDVEADEFFVSAEDRAALLKAARDHYKE